MKAKRKFFSAVLFSAVAVGLLAGCEKKDDPITQAEKESVAKGAGLPNPGVMP